MRWLAGWPKEVEVEKNQFKFTAATPGGSWPARKKDRWEESERERERERASQTIELFSFSHRTFLAEEREDKIRPGSGRTSSSKRKLAQGEL